MASIQHSEINKLLRWMEIRAAAAENGVSLDTLDALEATLALWDEEKIAKFIHAHAQQPCTLSVHMSEGQRLGRRLTLRFQFATEQTLNATSQAAWKRTFAHYTAEVYLDYPDHTIIWVELHGINPEAEE